MKIQNVNKRLVPCVATMINIYSTYQSVVQVPFAFRLEINGKEMQATAFNPLKENDLFSFDGSNIISYEEFAYFLINSNINIYDDQDCIDIVIGDNNYKCVNLSLGKGLEIVNDELRFQPHSGVCYIEENNFNIGGNVKSVNLSLAITPRNQLEYLPSSLSNFRQVEGWLTLARGCGKLFSVKVLDEKSESSDIELVDMPRQLETIILNDLKGMFIGIAKNII